MLGNSNEAEHHLKGRETSRTSSRTPLKIQRQRIKIERQDARRSGLQFDVPIEDIRCRELSFYPIDKADFSKNLGNLSDDWSPYGHQKRGRASNLDQY
ncbi:hypothetical protein, partial [Brevundimonas naejangsanensis]